MKRDRNWFYKMLAIAKKQLNMDDDSYRAMLADFGASEKKGKVSATTLTDAKLAAVYDYMRQLGFKPKPSTRSRTNQVESQLAVIKKYWDALHTAEVMRNPYSEKTVSAYAKRHTGVANIRWAKAWQISNTIEALKDTAARHHVPID